MKVARYKQIIDVKGQKPCFEMAMFGRIWRDGGIYNQKIDALFDKYGDSDIIVKCTIVAYEGLEKEGKVVIKNVPITLLYRDDSTLDRIVIGRKVVALEIYAKAFKRNKDTNRTCALGGNTEDAKLFSYKVVFDYKGDVKNLGYFKGAKIISKEELSKECDVFDFEGYAPRRKREMLVPNFY